MAKRTSVHDALERFSREAGMRKKSGRWYRLSDEVISVCEVQKSQYGPSYYLNVGFWLRAYGDPDAPRHYQCHIHCRLETLCVEDRGHIGALPDLETPWMTTPGPTS